MASIGPMSRSKKLRQPAIVPKEALGSDAGDSPPKPVVLPPIEPKAPPAEETVDQARLRAQRCMTTIQKVLQDHGCSIVPMLNSEQVGQGPTTRMLVAATYFIMPHPREGG